MLHAVAFASAHSCNCFISSSSSDQAKLLSWSRLNSRRTEPANSHILREHTVLVSPWTWEGVWTRSHLHNITQLCSLLGPSVLLHWKRRFSPCKSIWKQDLLAQADDHLWLCQVASCYPLRADTLSDRKASYLNQLKQLSHRCLTNYCEIMQGANDAGVKLHTPFHRSRGSHHSHHKVHEGLLNEVRRNSQLSRRRCGSPMVYPWHPSINSSGRVSHAIVLCFGVGAHLRNPSPDRQNTVLWNEDPATNSASEMLQNRTTFRTLYKCCIQQGFWPPQDSSLFKIDS